MQDNHQSGPRDIGNFFIAGINYRKTDAAIRGQFALNQEQYKIILSQSTEFSITEFFIVSTCNRTEIYGFAQNAEQLSKLLCSQTPGLLSTFLELSYTKRGFEAVEHLFHVGAGLDSQILGDYEIVSQIKQSAKLAKQYSRMGSFTERLINGVLQSSKAIKNKTKLSDGTVSVAFAAIQYIRENVKDPGQKRLLLLGTGKMGAIISRNLVDYLKTNSITLVNRTDEKALRLSKELGLQAASMDKLDEQIRLSDIILVATSSEVHVINSAQLQGMGDKLILDLSIPHNVDPRSNELENVTLVNVDELSKMKDETLARRLAEVPKATAIIEEYVHEFEDWYKMRKHVPVLKAVKTKLREIQASPLYVPLYDHAPTRSCQDDKIQRVINGMANRLKTHDQRGCCYIQAINEFIENGTN